MLQPFLITAVQDAALILYIFHTPLRNESLRSLKWLIKPDLISVAFILYHVFARCMAKQHCDSSLCSQAESRNQLFLFSLWNWSASVLREWMTYSGSNPETVLSYLFVRVFYCVIIIVMTVIWDLGSLYISNYLFSWVAIEQTTSGIAVSASYRKTNKLVKIVSKLIKTVPKLQEFESA